MLLHFQPISEYKLNVQIRGLGCLGTFPRIGKGLAADGDLVDHDAHLTKTNRELCGKTCLPEESHARWECLVPSSYRVTDEDRPEKLWLQLQTPCSVTEGFSNHDTNSAGSWQREFVSWNSAQLDSMSLLKGDLSCTILSAIYALKKSSVMSTFVCMLTAGDHIIYCPMYALLKVKGVDINNYTRTTVYNHSLCICLPLLLTNLYLHS